MCCQDDDVLDLPPAAIEALAHYRALAADRAWDWGDEHLPEFFRLARFSRLGDLTAALGATGGDWPAAIRRLAGDAPAPGLAVVEVGDAVAVHAGPPALTVPGRPVSLDVVVDAARATAPTTLTLGGRTIDVDAGGAAVEVVEVDGDAPGLLADAVRTVPAATLRVASSAWARWSVVDAAGGAWFPDGAPRKWDGAHRPYFHARVAGLTVPSGPITVTCTRGPEHVPASVTVDVDGAATVELEPPRICDPAAEGWASADLHVHLNYSGDQVVAPEQAHAMQRGEGLALMNLTAGNLSGARVYDRELFEGTVGRDLWGPDGGHVARTSVEFRNDLLGHVHALAPTAAPARYQTGHEGSPHPDDWPPNAVACADLHEKGASTAYAHPAFAPFGGPDDPYGAFFRSGRLPEARALVVDAALGLVDGLEVVSCFDDGAAAELFGHLLGCGLRPAAVAGSDAFLSFAHGPGVASNPPGWCRMYADLAGAPLSAPAVRDAVRAGRTTVTNGPFLTLEVGGAHGPGAVLDARVGDVLDVRARVRGTGAQEVTLRGPDGVLARREVDGPDVVLSATVEVDGPLWLAAAAHGGPHPLDAARPVFAHTSAVHVEVDGASVARAADARWCLGFLDRFEQLVAAEGRFDPVHRDARLADHTAVIDRARAVYAAALARAPR